MRRPLGAFLLAVLLACACGAEPDRPRCAHCGMRVDPASPFRTGATDAQGAERSFDSPKCLLRWLHGEGRGAREPWAIGYYTGGRRPAAELFWVEGGDVRGPMGRDLVPVEDGPRAERFAGDHGGRVLAWDAIDAATIDRLFAP